MTHVFISYSRKDTEFVDRLEIALNGRGIITWRDVNSIPGGARWFGRIKQGLESSYAVIYVDTPDADQSEWVETEFLYAKYLKLHMLPVKRDPAYVTPKTIILNPIVCDDARFAAGIAQISAQLSILSKASIVPDATAPSPAAPEIAPAVPVPAPLLTLDESTVRDYLDWVLAKAEADRRDALYVELAAAQQQVARPAKERSDLDDEFVFTFGDVALETVKDLEKPGEEVSAAGDAIRTARRAVLLGEPGAGKTTTLYKLRVDLARAAQADPLHAPLPVHVPLREFDGSVTFAAFIESRMHNLRPHGNGLLNSGRFVLLCDALNEMPRRAKSDGRDLVAEVREFLKGQPDWVVSCRVRDYEEKDGIGSLPNVGIIRLKPLDPPRIRDFIMRKFADYGDAARGESLWREMKGNDDLIAAWDAFVVYGASNEFWRRKWLPEKPYLWEKEGRAWDAMHTDHRRLMLLARNPFMTGMICALYHQKHGQLPANRAALFTQFVGNLLLAEAKRQRDVGLTWIGDAPIRAALGRIAWAMGGQTEMTRAEAEAIIAQHVSDHAPGLILSAAAAAQLIESGSEVRFTHQLIQEYFAASVLGRMMDEGADLAAIWQPERWWEPTGREETAILLAGDRNDPHAVARWIAPAQPHLALELLSQPDFALDLAALDPDTRSALVAGARSKSGEAVPRGRAAAWRVLGKFNADDRPGVGLRPDGLPDIVWCAIDDDHEWLYGDDREKHPPLPAYSIAKYPVTYAQFEVFAASPDYSDSEWWKGLVGVPDEQKQAPYEQAFQYANHPRERVSWFQAVAFTRWLTARLRKAGVIGAGQKITLPTEQQWERAARGTDGREFPWVGEFNGEYCNWRESGINMTSAVGLFPAGAAPSGALDMSGNVWEWCLTVYETGVQGENVRAENRVLRGGSWGNRDADDLRAACRGYLTPDSRNVGRGFRLALS